MQEENKKYKIVLVEDEEILANLISQKFERAGYKMLVAHDGEKGLELITTEKPDLVLLDMLLPKKSGFQILEGMQEAGMLPATPVIIISNSGQEVEIERASKMGVRDHLVKINFDPEELLGKVASLLAGEGEAPPKKETKSADKSGKASVLVVEDDIFLADLLCRKLDEHFIVYQASETKKAQELLDSNHVDAICLDIILPGMDGISFLKIIKQQDKLKAIPVLIVSNLGQREEIDRGMEAGASDYLIKANVSLDEIVSRIEGLLKKHSASVAA